MNEKEKLAWLKQASDEELLNQYCGLKARNEYGCNDGDIALTRNEILARMGGKK